MLILFKLCRPLETCQPPLFLQTTRVASYYSAADVRTCLYSVPVRFASSMMFYCWHLATTLKTNCSRLALYIHICTYIRMYNIMRIVRCCYLCLFCMLCDSLIFSFASTLYSSQNFYMYVCIFLQFQFNSLAAALYSSTGKLTAVWPKMALHVFPLQLYSFSPTKSEASSDFRQHTTISVFTSFHFLLCGTKGVRRAAGMCKICKTWQIYEWMKLRRLVKQL